MVEATLALLYDAAQVRLAGFGASYLARTEAGLSTEAVTGRLRHLHGGLEVLALLPIGADQDAVAGRLIEVYGLLAVAQDPFLRPLLPAIPVAGASVRLRVRGGNGVARGGNLTYLNAPLLLEPVPIP